jgi:hypothetical protein
MATLSHCALHNLAHVPHSSTLRRFLVLVFEESHGQIVTATQPHVQCETLSSTLTFVTQPVCSKPLCPSQTLDSTVS